MSAVERDLLAAVLGGAAIDATLGLSPTDFEEPLLGHVFAGLVDLHADGGPLALGLLEARLATAEQRYTARELCSVGPLTVRNRRHVERLVDAIASAASERRARDVGHRLWEGEITRRDAAEQLAAIEQGTPGSSVVSVSPIRSLIESDHVEPIVGARDAALLPAGGKLGIVGPPGAGKTTESIDLGAHLATGSSWLGFAIAVPRRVLVIEAEGPRAPFVEKLRRRLVPLTDEEAARVLVATEPWGALDLGDPQVAAAIARVIADEEIDVVIGGPIVGLGATGTGTPDDVRAFEEALARVARLARRDVAWVLVHHEAKDGRTAGAYDRLFDTVLRLRPGKRPGDVTAAITKARWASSLHGTSLRLVWADGDSFALADADPGDGSQLDDERAAEARAWIVSYVAERPDTPRGKVEAAYAAEHPQRGARALARRLVDEAATASRTASPTWLAVTLDGPNGATLLNPPVDAGSPLAESPNGERGEPVSPSTDGLGSRFAVPLVKGAADGERSARAADAGNGNGHGAPSEPLKKALR